MMAGAYFLLYLCSGIFCFKKLFQKVDIHKMFSSLEELRSESGENDNRNEPEPLREFFASILPNLILLFLWPILIVMVLNIDKIIDYHKKKEKRSKKNRNS